MLMIEWSPDTEFFAKIYYFAAATKNTYLVEGFI